MATQTQTTIPTQADPGVCQTGRSGVHPYRLTVRQFLKILNAGVFGDEERIELLGGLLVEKMTTYDPHEFAVSKSAQLLRRLLEPTWTIREEKSVVLGIYWRPLPDISVARGPLEHYRAATPTAANLGLLIEVADPSYA
jgi:Uma2 family endonuclease